MKFLLKPFVQLWKVFDHSLFHNCTLESKTALSFCLLPFAHRKNLTRGRAEKQPLNQHVVATRSDHKGSVPSSYLRDNPGR